MDLFIFHKLIHFQLRRQGDDEPDGAIEGETPKKEWVSVPNPNGVVREVKEKRVISREETEEVREMEESQHLGDITDEVSCKTVLNIYWNDDNIKFIDLVVFKCKNQ